MRRGVGGGEVPRRCTDADTIDGAGGWTGVPPYDGREEGGGG